MFNFSRHPLLQTIVDSDHPAPRRESGQRRRLLETLEPRLLFTAVFDSGSAGHITLQTDNDPNDAIAQIAVADLNGDGYDDLVAARAGETTWPDKGEAVSVFLATPTGDGIDNSNHTEYLIGDGESNPTSGRLEIVGIELADVDNDGDIDIITGNGLEHRLPGSNLDQGSISILFNDGSGRFFVDPNAANPVVNKIDIIAGQDNHDIVAVDLDGSGFVEILAVGRESSDIYVIKRDAASTSTNHIYNTQQVIDLGANGTAGANPRGLAVAHLDGDAYLDLAVTIGGLNTGVVSTVEIYRGQEVGAVFSFAPLDTVSELPPR